MALLGKRQPIDFNYVIEHASEVAHDFTVALPIESSFFCEGGDHEFGQVDGSQESSSIRRERLLATIVRVQSISIKCIDSWNLDIVYIFLAIFC